MKGTALVVAYLLFLTLATAAAMSLEVRAHMREAAALAEILTTHNQLSASNAEILKEVIANQVLMKTNVSANSTYLRSLITCLRVPQAAQQRACLDRITRPER